MGEDFVDDCGIFDTRDDSASTTAFGTGQDVDVEDPGEEFGPEHVAAQFGFAGVLCLGWGILGWEVLAYDFGA